MTAEVCFFFNDIGDLQMIHVADKNRRGKYSHAATGEFIP
jgi:hypothetical protein